MTERILVPEENQFKWNNTTTPDILVKYVNKTFMNNLCGAFIEEFYKDDTLLATTARWETIKTYRN
jgi:hypothetical protein